MDDHVALGGDWLLWRDFAVRSAGFPVEGLDAFGPGDEPSRLQAVCGDAAFREAVTWQNPAAVANALDKVAAGGASANSKARRREDVVASYWQRYCGKTDTIGFYGPLAWGEIDERAPAPLHARSGPLVRERSVHLESWGVQTLAGTLHPELRVALGPHSETDLRALLEQHLDADLRERGLSALERLEAARDDLAHADREQLGAALAALDATFSELTGVAPTRNHGRAYGARTLAYIDCMRDLDVTVGQAFLDELAPGVIAVFEAARWYSGRIQAIGEQVVQAALPQDGPVPFGAVLGRIMGPLMELPPQIGAEVAELQRRMAELVADPDPATLAARAAAAFADHRPAWPLSTFQSVDVQVAARDARAIADGDFLAVIGDVHPGNNPLGQSLFGDRHPDRERMLRLLFEDVRPALPFLLPPWAPGRSVDARGVAMFADDTIHISINPESCAPRGHRTWRLPELLVDGPDLVDRSGELRVALIDVFTMPIFVSGVRTFEPWGDVAHAPRLTAGKVVLRRELWNLRHAEVPQRPEELAAWGAALGTPRRMFVKTPVERKPFYLDLESPVLGRIACRHIRAAGAEDPDAMIRFSEMLPSTEECWLTDPDGRHYASELRLTGLDGRATGRSAGPRR